MHIFDFRVADGKAIIDTELDNSDFKKGLSELKGEGNELPYPVSVIQLP